MTTDRAKRTPTADDLRVVLREYLNVKAEPSRPTRTRRDGECDAAVRQTSMGGECD